MMRLIITIVFVLSLPISRLFSQNTFAQNLLQLEREFFYSNNDTQKIDLILKKIDLYIKNDSINVDLLREIKRINADEINSSLKKEKFLWNASLVSFFINDYNLSKHYMKKYEYTNKDTGIVFYVLSSLIYHRHDSEKVTFYLKEAIKKDNCITSLTCLNKTEEEIKISGGKLMTAFSYIIPGSGTIMTGRPIKGLTSMILTGGLGATTYLLASAGLYMNAVFISFPWFYKFYFGQARLTKKIITEKQNNKKLKEICDCEKNLKLVLDKYPITFRQ